MRGFEVRVGGGTSIMPRIAPTLYEFVEADNGDYLKVAEAVFRIFDRQDWLRENRARARIKVFVDKFGIDELPRRSRRSWRATGSASATSTPSRACSSTTRRPTPPRRPAATRQPERRPLASSSASASANVTPSARPASPTVQIKVTRGDLTPEQFRGLAAIMRDFTGGYARTTSTRTSCCAGCATRRSTTSGSG